MPDATIYRAGTPDTLIASVDAVLGFTSTRDARTVNTPIPAGGLHTVVRPHGPRSGTFQFLFAGTDAQARAEALEASLAQGTSHFLSGAVGGTSTWRWRTTGQITVERVQDARGVVWIVSADWTAL